MSQVLVDRELLERMQRLCADPRATRDEADDLDIELRAILAQPAEAEGVVAWAPSTALEKLKAGFNNAPCVLTDGPAEFNNVPLVTLAALSAVTAERDRLRDAAGKAIAWLDAEQNGSGVGINRRLKLCRDAENSLRAAMAAKEPEPEHVCSGCGAKGWTGNCLECIPY